MFGWLRGSKRQAEEPLSAWRTACAAALEGDRSLPLEELRRRLASAAETEADVEVENEMLEALERLQALEDAGTLPVVETQHRVIGGDACHFTAPASLPDDPGQASGRVLLTPARAIFVGSGRSAATAWHAVHQVARLDRDVLLVRADGTAAAQFRFNTFGDAVESAYLARRLKGGPSRRL